MKFSYSKPKFSVILSLVRPKRMKKLLHRWFVAGVQFVAGVHEVCCRAAPCSCGPHAAVRFFTFCRRFFKPFWVLLPYQTCPLNLQPPGPPLHYAKRCSCTAPQASTPPSPSSSPVAPAALAQKKIKFNFRHPNDVWGAVSMPRYRSQ